MLQRTKIYKLETINNNKDNYYLLIILVIVVIKQVVVKIKNYLRILYVFIGVKTKR